MDQRDREFLIEQLDASESEFMAGLEGLSAAESAFRPAPATWTILDCMEHVVAVETLTLRGMTSRALPLAEPLVRRGQAARLRDGGSRKAGKLETPERVRPSGRYASIEEGKAAFRAVRGRVREYVTNTQDDLDSRVLPHPLFGEMTCYEWVLFLAGHARRHLNQILEVRDLERDRASTAAEATA